MRSIPCPSVILLSHCFSPECIRVRAQDTVHGNHNTENLAFIVDVLEFKRLAHSADRKIAAAVRAFSAFVWGAWLRVGA
jgi:hypothetical protein